jgi:hypothetical protein
MKAFYQLHPRLAGALSCAIIGALFGPLVIGNIGVARGGSASAMSGWFVGACLGAFIGLYIGERKLRKQISCLQTEQGGIK